MTCRNSLAYFAAAPLLFASCLSKSPAIPLHTYVPPLDPIDLRAEPGVRPLRFQGVEPRIELRRGMIWRISGTELVADEEHRWARDPSELLAERLGDLFYEGGGFRASLRPGDPSLQVALVACEGDVREGRSAAVLELILTLESGDTQHRRRLRLEEPLLTRDAEGFAAAMGKAVSQAADRTEAWTRSKL